MLLAVCYEASETRRAYDLVVVLGYALPAERAGALRAHCRGFPVKVVMAFEVGDYAHKFGPAAGGDGAAVMALFFAKALKRIRP